ncbi:putative nuclease HARBI1 [Rhagoletis pomonella]|uniref:putative nuclease HARBI1 n=1 Tax=Rhagoletis pomonella TaxID=28610 RepID=UPI00177AC860|nr:putative nuclease HARBI1 [Rhagoletis pomonella]
MSTQRVLYINRLEEIFEDSEQKTASHRQYRYRPDYLERYDDNEFIKRFRLSKPTFRYCSISPRTKLMLALRFYASGSFLITVGDFCGVSVSTASRAVKEVSFALAALYKDFIQLPSDPTQTVAEFFQIAKFPKVIGVIDCTHVRVQSPGGGNAEIFRNRKGYFSINVQAMCNANLMFLDLVVRWPGSAHDYNIFRNSRLKFCMEEGHFSNYFILGDSGYKQTHYLMTPLMNPSNAPERLYNESQIRTRNSIERCFGVWKRRFPVLSIGLRISINSTMAVIVACGVLHNIAVLSKDPLPPMDELSLLEIPEDAAENNSVEINSNSVARNRLIQNYFARL